MKKFVVTIILALAVIALSLNFLIPALKDIYEISSMQPYYKDLAEKCKGAGSYNCCMASVNTMSAGNYQLMPEESCPAGLSPNLLKCIDSYTWCEPAK